MKDRADKLLHQSGLFDSRKKAQVAIEKGLVSRVSAQGAIKKITKPSEIIEWSEGDQWQVVADAEFAFVSRSGAKLQAALKHFQVSAKNKVCLDVGLSTGGFSQCLLEDGARLVVGVDVGTGQLHPSLQDEERLISIEKFNAREPLPRDLVARVEGRTGNSLFDLMVFDVSFISVLKVIEPQLSFLRTGGELVILVKPQFEVGREHIQKKGLVAAAEGLRVLEKTVKTIQDLPSKMPLSVIGTVEASPKGEDGNQEYFIYARS